jgi:gliding-associated putative ABC transporter substrate-binding component GldG
MSGLQSPFFKSLKSLILISAGLIGINLLSGLVAFRIDLTEEKRFTLTEATTQMLQNLPEEVFIEVFLEGNDLPAGIKQLSNHTRDLLQDMRRASKGRLNFAFTDLNTITDVKAREERQKQLVRRGLLPVNLEVNAESGYSEKLIFPGALISYQGKEAAITILENQMLFGAQGAIDNSMNFLEYKLANAIHKLGKEEMPMVRFLQGHGEVEVAQVSDFLETLARQNFRVDKLELGVDSLLNGKTDVLIVAKPQQAFSEDHKFLLDQYLMHGGKIIWLIDEVMADMDSFRLSPSIFSIPRDLNLQDMLFRYGARINQDLVQDLYCVPVPIVEEIAGNPQPKLYPWVFYPVVRGNHNHPATKNLDPVLMRFASSIDTIRAEGVRKTILLSTSEYSRTQKIPFQIYLEGARQKPLPALFNRQYIPVAILLEGDFKSHYHNRIQSAYYELMAREGAPIKTMAQTGAKMIVISDGDVIVNEIDQNGRPLPLGFYRINRETFANKDFLLNCIEYLLDDAGLIAARNRDIRMRMLDKAKVNDQERVWQFIAVGLPVPLLLITGIAFSRRRRRRWS